VRSSPGRWLAAQPPTTRGGFRRPPRSRARRCRRPRPVSTIVRGGSVIANPPWCHHTSVVLDRGEVVMFSSPIDSAIQAQGVITPSIVRSSTSLGGVTRCPNRGAQRSVISLAVRDSSTPQEFVASKGSKLGNNCREVNRALSFAQRHPTTTPRDLAPCAPFFRKTSSVGKPPRHRTGSRPVGNRLCSHDQKSVPTKR
jgi:hypothetical protein